MTELEVMALAQARGIFSRKHGPEHSHTARCWICGWLVYRLAELLGRPRVGPEAAAVILAADRLVDADPDRLRLYYDGQDVDGLELAALRRAVAELRGARARELGKVNSPP